MSRLLVGAAVTGETPADHIVRASDGNALSRSCGHPQFVTPERRPHSARSAMVTMQAARLKSCATRRRCSMAPRVDHDATRKVDARSGCCRGKTTKLEEVRVAARQIG